MSSNMGIGSVMRVWSMDNKEFYGQGLIHSFCSTWARTKNQITGETGKTLVSAAIIELTQEPNKGTRILTYEVFCITEKDYMKALVSGDVPSTAIISQKTIASFKRHGILFQGGVLIHLEKDEKVPQENIDKLIAMIGSGAKAYSLDLSIHNIENDAFLITNYPIVDDDEPMDILMNVFINEQLEITNSQMAWLAAPYQEEKPKLTLVQ